MITQRPLSLLTGPVKVMTLLRLSFILLLLASAVVTTSGRSVSPATEKAASMTWMDNIFQKILHSWSPASPEKAEKLVADGGKDKSGETDATGSVEVIADQQPVTTLDHDERLPPTTSATLTTPPTSSSTTTPTPTTTTKMRTTTTSRSSDMEKTQAATTDSPAPRITSGEETTPQSVRNLEVAVTTTEKMPTTTSSVRTTTPSMDHHGEELYVVNKTVLEDVRMHCRYAIPLRSYQPNKRVHKRAFHATKLMIDYIKVRVSNAKRNRVKKRHLGRKFIVRDVFSHFDVNSDGVVTLYDMERLLEYHSIIRPRRGRAKGVRET